METGAEYKVKCSNVLLQLKNIKYYGDTRTGLVGYWKFDEGTGDTAYDSSGYGNDGTLYNGSTVCSGGDCPAWVDGVYGKALEFDGVNDYVNAPLVLSMGPPYTISAWIKKKGAGTNHSRVVGSSSGNPALFFWLDTDRLRYIFYADGSNRFLIGPYFTLDKYYHVVVVETGGAGNRLYINGDQYDETVYDVEGVINTIIIGGKSYAYFNGTIDDVRVYNRALTAGEVLDEYRYQSFVRGLLLHTGGAEGVDNVTITAAGGGHVNTTTAFTDSTFGPGSIYPFTINTTEGVSTAPDQVTAAARCGNIGVVAECLPGQGCMSSG